MFLTIAALTFGVAIIVFACQNKKAGKAMNEKKSDPQLADSGRLLSVASLEQSESNRKVTAWFFETPQIFEFSLGSEQAQQMYKLLKEAKDKQLPVTVYSSAIGDNNIIDRIIPATEAQIIRYNKEKSQSQQPVKVPPPPHQ